MDFRGLDLNLLVAMDALFTEKSVSHAGERLHLSQSATSGALARLRQVFRDPLLVQVGRSMTLTPLAEGLAELVRQSLIQAEAILYLQPLFNPATSERKFRLMMSDYVETVVMTEGLPRIQKMAPRVTFEISSNDGPQVLERGEIDLFITPEKYLSHTHPSEPLFDDEYVCAVWTGNTAVIDHLSLEQYLKLGHVLVRYGRQGQLPFFDAWFLEQFEYQRRTEVLTTTFNLVPQLLIGTLRIATLHRRLATFYARYLPLRLLPPPLKTPQLHELMQWHKSRDRDPGTVWLRSALKEALRGEARNEPPVKGETVISRPAVPRDNGRRSITVAGIRRRNQG
jgi:LysR family transcriptional regulator, nod-box dependent transcriptional activator